MSATATLTLPFGFEWFWAMATEGRVQDSLVSRAQEGERRAFDELFYLHHQRVYRACCAMLGDPHEAEDAVQQVFTQAFEQIGKFRGDSKFSTWLHGYALRITSNMRRGRSRRHRLSDAVSSAADRDGGGPTPEQQAQNRQALQDLDRALDVLSEKKRTAFLLHCSLELSLTEVASLMGASVQTTYARVKAARMELVEAVRSLRGPREDG